MTPRLSVIPRPATPEDDLRHLFRREADLVRDLAQVRADMRDPIRRYAEARGMLMLPRVETLRREIVK